MAFVSRVNRRAAIRTDKLTRSTWLVQICFSSDSPQTFFLMMLLIGAGEYQVHAATRSIAHGLKAPTSSVDQFADVRG